MELVFDGEGNVTKHNIPPKIEVRELIHLLRPFVLESEPTYFYRIVNILGKYFEPKPFRVIFKAWRSRFSGVDSQEQIKIEIGNIIVNSEAALKLWLNAYEYHRDDDKRAVMAALREKAPYEMLEALFVDLLVRQTEAVLLVATFLRKVKDAPSAKRDADVRHAV